MVRYKIKEDKVDSTTSKNKIMFYVPNESVLLTALSMVNVYIVVILRN